MSYRQLPVPSFFDATKVETFWQVPYMQRAQEAREWQKTHNVSHMSHDNPRICLMIIDAQNTFCIPTGELFVMGAPQDNVRLCEFIYRNMESLTEIDPTMDTHTAMQIFHPVFLVDENGNNPNPMTMIDVADVENGKWKVNPAIAASLAGGNYAGLQAHLLHYCRKLKDKGKYSLMVWTYHSMLGGVGHALVSSVEEACFFHNMVRFSQTGFEIKGGNPLTENYSVLRPEVLDTVGGKPIAQKNARFIKKLLNYDYIVTAGQAGSHCFAWTIHDLLNEIMITDPKLVEKVYILRDCTSPVVVPGIVDFTKDMEQAFQEFSNAGMHLVTSTTPMNQWEGMHFA